MPATRKALRKFPGLFVSINELENGSVEIGFTYDEKSLGLMTWTPPYGGYVSTRPLKLDHLPGPLKTYILDYLEAFDKKRRGERFNPRL